LWDCKIKMDSSWMLEQVVHTIIWYKTLIPWTVSADWFRVFCCSLWISCSQNKMKFGTNDTVRFTRIWQGPCPTTGYLLHTTRMYEAHILCVWLNCQEYVELIKNETCSMHGRKRYHILYVGIDGGIILKCSQDGTVS